MAERTDPSVVWLRPEYQGREDELIHLADAADLVVVTRSAVSNWAARHRDFPKVVMVAGPPRRRSKWVVRDEFLKFARAQLAKPRSQRGRPAGPRRPRTVILTERIAHLEAQVRRYSGLEERHTAALDRARTSRRRAQAKLKTARDQLAAEAAALNTPPAKES